MRLQIEPVAGGRRAVKTVATVTIYALQDRGVPGRNFKPVKSYRRAPRTIEAGREARAAANV